MLGGKTNIDPARQNVGDAGFQGQGEPLDEIEGLGFESQVPIPLYLYIRYSKLLLKRTLRRKIRLKSGH